MEWRFAVLAGVAAAVEYLHEEWVQVVLHRDIKPSNVLLDADFSTHLGDFGLPRVIDHQKMDKTTMMAGTIGYIAPEISYSGKATKESDVYSFGILLVEVVCGRRPINLQVEDPDENFLLLQSVWRAHEAGNVLSAVDPELLIRVYWHQATAFSVGDVERRIVRLLHLGLQCCLSDPHARPSMRVVKQAIMQLQDNSAEDMLMYLALPIDGSVPKLPVCKPPVEREASFSETASVLRRRFYTE